MGTSELSDFIKQFEAVTKKPEKYLSLQEDEAEDIKCLTEKLYGFSKAKEFPSKQSGALNELVTKGLDVEQIWQQVELQNNSLHNHLVNYVARFLTKGAKLRFPIKEKKVEKVKSKGKSEKEKSHNEDEPASDSDESDKDTIREKSKKEKKAQKKSVKTSIVDDQFFKLHEMEEFLEKMEQPNGMEDDEDDELIDYFEGSSSESVDDDDDNDDEDGEPRYNDFFDEPDEEVTVSQKRKKSDEPDEISDKKQKKVKFCLDEDQDKDKDEDEDEDEVEVEDNSDFDIDEDGEEVENGIGSSDDENSDDDRNATLTNEKEEANQVPSTFEARQERLKSRISSLEENALKEKSWQMKGEITGENRPQNSLLQEYVEFDVATRPAPVLTEKSTMKLEDIIIQRIKDKAWDDVVRKIKPVEGEMEYKKKLVLDQEKSKLSLAQIYEKEYMKQVESKVADDGTKKEEVEPPEHQEIKIMMKNLFTKLDALSNFHFTPKQISTDIKVVSNLPAITMEEVAPVATSDAALLAPEEVKSKTKGDLIGKSERTATDKKRERRQKKLKQRLKFKRMEEKAQEKLDSAKDKSGVQSKKFSDKLLQKITKSSNVTALETKGSKYIRSSSTFFSKLQDETNSNVKKVGLQLGKKPKAKKKGKSRS